MTRRERFEPWAWLAFGLLGATLLLFGLMGSRPGGELAVLAYRWGPFAVGGISAAAMFLALAWSLRRRPVLQRGRAWPLTALAVSLWLCSLPIPYPSSHEGKPSPIRFRLPFEGEVRVLWGGEGRGTNGLVYDPSGRFGTCFELEGSQAVLAPAPGRIVAREAGRFGGRLVLEVAPEAFLVLDGLAAGDGLEPGASVQAGQPLGQASSRLCVFLMDGPGYGRAEGIPMRFWGYVADGRPVEAGVPIPPQRVGPGDPSKALDGGH
jgi:hypothetical protein